MRRTVLVAGVLIGLSTQAMALSCGELQQLTEAYDSTLKAQGDSCQLRKEVLNIQRKIKGYASFAKKCGSALAYLQHQSSNKDVIDMNKMHYRDFCSKDHL